MSRIALVTGGGGGIGSAICRALAKDNHRVAVADVAANAADAIATEIDGLAVAFDLTDATQTEAALQDVFDKLGPVDILVNCAGWDAMVPFVETDDAFMEKVLAINLAGPMRLSRLVLPHMIEQGWGRVITIASDAGRVGSSLEAVYSGAKGGMIAFMKTVARETARHGVTANSICPGPTDTPLLGGLAGDNAEKVVAAMTKAVPMKRLGTPEDIAPAVAFLASDGASFITGQTLSVSGGLTMA
jgi:2-hydroxycyclohexanecarboxyl-CoA dehydrogenase